MACILFNLCIWKASSLCVSPLSLSRSFHQRDEIAVPADEGEGRDTVITVATAVKRCHQQERHCLCTCPLGYSPIQTKQRNPGEQVVTEVINCVMWVMWLWDKEQRDLFSSTKGNRTQDTWKNMAQKVVPASGLKSITRVMSWNGEASDWTELEMTLINWNDKMK